MGVDAFAYVYSGRMDETEIASLRCFDQIRLESIAKFATRSRLRLYRSRSIVILSCLYIFVSFLCPLPALSDCLRCAFAARIWSPTCSRRRASCNRCRHAFDKKSAHKKSLQKSLSKPFNKLNHKNLSKILPLSHHCHLP